MKKLFAFLALFTFTIVEATGASAPKMTNMSALLASPDKFEGVKIIVTGYVCRAGGSAPGLFLVRSDCADANYSNGVKLDVDGLLKTLPKKTTLLTVEGTFEDWSDEIFVDEPFFCGQIKVTSVSGRSLR